MWLPAPDAEAVESFRSLVRAEFGLELDPTDAREAATRLILIHSNQDP